MFLSAAPVQVDFQHTCDSDTQQNLLKRPNRQLSLKEYSTHLAMRFKKLSKLMQHNLRNHFVYSLHSSFLSKPALTRQ